MRCKVDWEGNVVSVFARLSARSMLDKLEHPVFQIILTSLVEDREIREFRMYTID